MPLAEKARSVPSPADAGGVIWKVQVVSLSAPCNSTGAEAGSTFQPAGASRETFPFTRSADEITRTLIVFGLAVPKNKNRARKFDKDRRRDDERARHFSRDAIDFPETRFQRVGDLLITDSERELNRKGRRIFRSADQRLIRDREGAERPRFAQPIRLRKRKRLRQLHRGLSS